MKTKPPAMTEPNQREHDAWECHRALVFTEFLNPKLRDNPHWQLLRMDAFENFSNAMVGVQNNGN